MSEKEELTRDVITGDDTATAGRQSVSEKEELTRELQLIVSREISQLKDKFYEEFKDNRAFAQAKAEKAQNTALSVFAGALVALSLLGYLNLQGMVTKQVETQIVQKGAAEIAQAVKQAQQESTTLSAMVSSYKPQVEEALRKVARAGSAENVRAFVKKEVVDGICPKGTEAAHVPWAYSGKSGDEICAANNREKRTCVIAKMIHIRNDNGHEKEDQKDKTCSQQIEYPWPWGYQHPSPNTHAAEWNHGSTHAVCCR